MPIGIISESGYLGLMQMHLPKKRKHLYSPLSANTKMDKVHNAQFSTMVLCVEYVGFITIDVRNKSGSLGYWLSNTCLGKGIMTMSVKTIVKTGFMEYGLNRVEIACATGNLKSRAIPERLGFVFEGTLRERELLCGKYVDHAIYSLLASEFALNKALHRTSQ
jgi:RimJ/RimL family protein N-acetyltransferase